jgi:hypothetical protein
MAGLSCINSVTQSKQTNINYTSSTKGNIVYWWERSLSEFVMNSSWTIFSILLFFNFAHKFEKLMVDQFVKKWNSKFNRMFTPLIRNNSFNIIIPKHFRITDRNIECVSHIRACYMLHPSYHPWFHYPVIGARVYHFRCLGHTKGLF